jgi:hypothetical protein
VNIAKLPRLLGGTGTKQSKTRPGQPNLTAPKQRPEEGGAPSGRALVGIFHRSDRNDSLCPLPPRPPWVLLDHEGNAAINGGIAVVIELCEVEKYVLPHL